MVNNNNNIEDHRWDQLDQEHFQSYFDSDGRLVKDHEFRKSVFKGENEVSKTSRFDSNLFDLFFSFQVEFKMIFELKRGNISSDFIRH